MKEVQNGRSHKPMPLEPLASRPKAELMDIAEGIAAGEIFTDRHLHRATPSDFQGAIARVFRPIAVGALNQYGEDFTKSIGLIFEHGSKAVQIGEDGLPIFMSFRLLNNEDADFVLECVQDLNDLQRQGDTDAD